MKLPGVLIGKENLQVFWSAYDPLDLASESIDPLGFMAGYVALADRLLPGFTTITTVPRYAGMLCFGLKLAEDSPAVKRTTSAADRRRLILEQLKLLERGWALACGLAERDTSAGTAATNGLRGIREVRRQWELHANSERVSLNFALLSNQVRYGGIGAYSVFLEALHLADMTALTLRPLGEQLAAAFPSPAMHDLFFHNANERLPVAALREWGKRAHAGAQTATEAKWLRFALQGGEEKEIEDVTRWFTLRLLRACDGSDGLNAPLDEPQLLTACLARIRKGGAARLDRNGGVAGRVEVALRLIEPYERLYQSALFLFDHIRHQATSTGEVALAACVRGRQAQAALSELRKAAATFLRRVESATSEPTSLGEAKSSLMKLGLVELARTFSSTTEAIRLCKELLQRHQRVQEGKLDGGLPKAPWVRLASGQEGVVQLADQQRFGLGLHEVRASWRAVPSHPYRTAGAKQFVRLCRIT